jgi:hypothetical protein
MDETIALVERTPADFAEAKILLKVEYAQAARGRLPEVSPFGIGAETAILGGETQLSAAKNMRSPDFYEIEATVFGRIERRRLISVEVNAVNRLDIRTASQGLDEL